MYKAPEQDSQDQTAEACHRHICRLSMEKLHLLCIVGGAWRRFFVQYDWQRAVPFNKVASFVGAHP